MIFAKISMDKEEVPAPPFFLEVVKSQWTHPGTFPNPGVNDRRFYNLDQTFSQALQVHSIDIPVVALSSSATVVSGDVADQLKPEDKKVELI